MPGFNPDNINIHDLTIEEPGEEKPKLIFDPEKEITENEWNSMNQELNYHYQNESWGSFCRMFRTMKVLDAAELRLSKHSIKEQQWSAIMQTLGGNIKDGFWSDFGEMAVAVKSLDSKEGLDVSQESWDGMMNSLKYYAQSRGVDFGGLSTKLAANMKILNPKMGGDINKVVEWKYIADNLEELKEKESWFQFSKMAADIKILNPAFEVNIDEKDWHSMQKTLGRLRDSHTKNWVDFAKQAMALKILAAKEVNIADKGLEINMRKSSLEESDSLELPEQRKF